jgi:hypothetical protein
MVCLARTLNTHGGGRPAAAGQKVLGRGPGSKVSSAIILTTCSELSVAQGSSSSPASAQPAGICSGRRGGAVVVCATGAEGVTVALITGRKRIKGLRRGSSLAPAEA